LCDRFNGLRNGGFLAHRNHQGVEVRQKSVHPESPSERIAKNIRRATRKQYSPEEKIRVPKPPLRWAPLGKSISRRHFAISVLLSNCAFL
jgi:hypothetical protein